MNSTELPLQTLKCDLLNVRIFENRQALGEDAAELAGKTIRDLLTGKSSVNIIFASAPSQNEFLEALATEPGIDWSKVNVFHMDEYIGLPGDARQAFGTFLKHKIFDKLPIGGIYYINGNAESVTEECERYTALLNKYPTDIVFMGIGENCHIAFNDPHVADFNDPVLIKEVSLDMKSRQQQVNDKCFDRLDEVPTHALTLTIPALLKAETVLCMVPGVNKAEAIHHTLSDEITEVYPSTILRRHPNATLFIDKDSSGKLS